MKKHLLLHLGIMGLMGLSTIAYGGWTKYGPEFKSGDPIPNGDCLEMMCEHGCVEDENGLNGTCCPNDGTNGSACTIGACCKSGSCINGKCGCEKDTDCPGEQVCLSGVCVCSNEGTAYTKLDNTIGCCNSTTHVLNDIENSDKKVCCPAETPIWDAEQQKCVECLVDEDCEGEATCDPTTKTCVGKCVPLYTNKQYNREVNGSPCCDNLITSTANVLFSGYNKEDGKKYGCCPKERTFEQTCCKTTQKALTTGCCDNNKIYVEGIEEKCCLSPSLLYEGKCIKCLVNYGEGFGACLNKDAPICNAEHKCVSCPANKPYFYNGECYACTDLPENQLNVSPTNITNGSKNGVYTVLDWTTFPVEAKIKIHSLCIDDYLRLYFNYNEEVKDKIQQWNGWNVFCKKENGYRDDQYTIPANTPFKLKIHDKGSGNVDWQGSITIHAICS